MSDIALTVSILALVAVVGLFIGNVKFRGIGLGIGGVLFGGIIVGHFVSQAGMTLSSDMLHVIQEFGLILFVYTIGIQVGPGFFASLRVSGLRLNLFAVLIVIIGGLVTAILHKLFDIPLPVVLGIFSGAVTNTPALGAGQQILRDLGTPMEMVDQMGMSYAMAYPFGICGILFTMWMLRVIFRVNVETEAQQHESSRTNGGAYAVRSKALPTVRCRRAAKKRDILHPASRGTPARTRHLAVLCAIVPRNHLSGRFHKRHTDTAPGTSLFLAPSQHFFGAQAASRQVLYN